MIRKRQRALLTVFISVLCIVAVTVPFHAQRAATASAGLATVGTGDWPMYQGDPMRSGANLSETIITPATAPYLTLAWKFTTGGPVVASPVIANGVLYIGSWDGYEYAVSIATHQQLWRQFLGTTTQAQVQPTCYGTPVGITSSPTVNAQTGILYVGGGDGYLYALNTSDGSIAWKTFLGAPPAYNWTSPLLYNGRVYTGVSAYCDPPNVQGMFYAFDADTGSLAASLPLVSSGQVGGGVWASPAVDATTGEIYIATANNAHATMSQEPNSESLLALDPNTLAILDHWQIPSTDQPASGDADFGATPTLFDLNGSHYIGDLNKSGIYYVLDRTHLAAGPVWQQVLGGTPLQEGPRVSSACFDTGVLYVGSGPVQNTSIKGTVHAFDAATGALIWGVNTTGNMYGSVTCVPGLVVDDQGHLAEVRAATTGQIRFSYATNANILGTSVISNGVLYVPSKDGAVYAFTVQNSSIGQLIFQDNFDAYAVGPPPLGAGTSQWTSLSVTGTGFSVKISASQAQSAPNAVQFSLGSVTGGHASLRKNYPTGTGYTTHAVRFSLYLDPSLQFTGQNIALLTTQNASNTADGSISLHLTPTKALQVVLHNSLGQAVTKTLTTRLSQGQWYTLELDQTNNPTNGAWSLWLNGTQITGQTGVDMGNVPVNAIIAGDTLNSTSGTISGSFYIDNVVSAAQHIG